MPRLKNVDNSAQKAMPLKVSGDFYYKKFVTKMSGIVILRFCKWYSTLKLLQPRIKVKTILIRVYNYLSGTPPVFITFAALI